MKVKTYIIGTAAVVGTVAGMSGSAMAAASYTYGANAAGNTVTAPLVTQEATKTTASLISGRVSAAVSGATGGGGVGGGGAPGGGGLFAPTNSSSLMPNGKGYAGGNGDGKGKASGSAPRNFGVWLNGAGTWLENEQANAEFKGSIYNVMGGADYLIKDRFLVGLSAGYERADIKTTFNSGKLESDGFTVAPYFAFILNKNVSFDVSVGHSWVDYDVSRGSGAVTGNTSGDRWFGTANANYTTSINNWQLGATLGYLYTMEKQDAYTESNGGQVGEVSVHLGQARLGGKVGYLAPTSFGYLNPYGSARLEYDVVKDGPGVVDAAGTKANDDDFGVTFGLGVAAGIGEATTINVEATTTQFRDDLKNYGVSGTVRYRF